MIWFTWAAFAVDYAVNLTIARPRWRWFSTHLLDLAIVVLPILRPLRLLRLLVVLNLFQRSAGAAFRGRVVLYAAGGATLLVYVAALAELDAERGHGGSIQDFGEVLWWALVTMTTVGYGDFDPVTVEGRIIAVFVMVGGISLLGVITATIASWVVERVAREEEREEERSETATAAHVDRVLAELAELRTEIHGLRTEPEQHGDFSPRRAIPRSGYDS